ncbi:MAG: Asp-tRNA(Asn)/Glu-tRNA(Gln) amidotransferase subunit GatB [Patescibacteria group bacterium]|nr:Asp-tRNA(Asn)/Glu-tRNA(Gln) amidotransferase subunit GatB [Patescibacteria group bacterium]
MKYIPTIGLEVHAELKTRTKMFCDSANDPEETRPNVNVCPVCMAHPGTLPVINREAVRHIVRIGTAIRGRIADFTEFDRKSYFYPDIPKGFQISQYEHPLVTGGELVGVAITRVHLEEDTARSSHAGGKSLVDFNRAGIPLMELVTEPVLHDAETAGRFARELQLLLRTLGAGEANLEKGEMRIEANVSVSAKEGEFGLNQSEGLIGRTGQRPVLGTKVEVKNINSFRSVERAIAFEVKRQSALLEKGGKVVQETRGWDEAKQETFHQRFKEGSADYRYFPEPDLPKLFLSEIPEFSPEALRASLPELPWERRARYEALGIRKEYADVLVQPENAFLMALIEGVAKRASNNDKTLIGLAANYIVSDVAGLMQDSSVESKFSYTSADDLYQAFFNLMRMVEEEKVSSRGAKDVLAAMYRSGGDPETIAKGKGLLQVHDASALQEAVSGVLKEEAKAVAEYRAGKEAALQYLIGKSMKATKGAGNPGILKELIVKELGK